jgi:glycosyltransferase involved in cell wall biosynthesis
MRYAKTLKENGHTVRVVTKGNPENSGIDEATGYEMHYVPELWLPLITHLAHKQKTLVAKPVRKTLKKAISGADVVHVYQAWPLGSTACSIAKKLGVPSIAAFHIQPENITWNLGLSWSKPASVLAYFLFKVLYYRRFKHIHCPSLMIAAQLRKRGYKAWLHVVSNGVDPAFCPDPDVERFDDGKFHITMVARFSREKRQEVLLKAVSRSRYRDIIQVHLAGHGPREKKLRRIGRALPNPPDIAYHNQDSLIDLLRRCHLYVHASDIEIEGMGCTEAFSCGLPPLISDSKISATGSFALDDRHLFQSRDADSLAQKIDYWIENPQALEEASRDYIEYSKSFMLKDCVRQMEKIYARLHISERCIYYRSRIFRLMSRVFTNFIAVPILFFLTRAFLGARVEGGKNLRRLSGSLTICNHVHYLDNALVCIAQFPRKTVFPTLGKNMRGIFPGALVTLLGGAPVPENISDLKLFFDEMEMRLHMGQNVHFFPEGHLEPYHPEIRDFKNGAFHLAAKARVPIVPLTICFVPPTGIYRLFRRKPVMRLVIGKPIYPLAANIKQDMKLRRDIARDWMQDMVSRSG